MSKHDKTLEKLRAVPPSANVKWDELTALLKHLGYQPIKPGKTGGSRRKFLHPERKLLISCHQPHPQPDVDKGCIADVADHLRTHGFL
jgi:hypothetical protein